MPALKRTASRPLALISAEKARQLPISGVQTFGLTRLRLAAAPEHFPDDPEGLKALQDTDALLSANEDAVGHMVHREQMGWVFRKLVQTADALNVAVSDPAALTALAARFAGEDLALAMITTVWAFTTIPRDVAEDERLCRDPLPEAIERARALNSRRKYKSTVDKAQERLLREIFTLTQGRASSPLQAA